MGARKLIVVYYSRTGNTEFLARQIADEIRAKGIEVNVKRVESCNPHDLINFDGIILGTPTHVSNVAWQIKKLMDDCVPMASKFKGKVGACFTSTGNRRDGQRCLATIRWAYEQAGMRAVRGLVIASSISKDEAKRRCARFADVVAKALME